MIRTSVFAVNVCFKGGTGTNLNVSEEYLIFQTDKALMSVKFSNVKKSNGTGTKRSTITLLN